MAKEDDSQWSSRLGNALMGFAAGARGRGDEFIERLDERRKKAMVDDASRVTEMLQANDIKGARELLANRVVHIKRLGGDPSDTLEELQKLDSGDVAGVLRSATALQEYAYQAGYMQRPEKQAGPVQRGEMGTRVVDANGKVTYTPLPPEMQALSNAPGAEGFRQGPSTLLKNKETGEYAYGTPQFDKGAGTSEYVQTNVPAGWEPVNTLGLTAPEKVLQTGREAEASGAGTTQGKGRSERANTFIESGYTAAQSIPTITRSLELLNTLGTGNVNKAAMLFKKAFGQESADEAEMSNLTGKNVVSQLRAIFGAQFTAAEGQWLKDMEAGWGTSTEGNKRLLNVGLKLARRRAQKGYEAAMATGDSMSADNIKSWMDYNLSDDEEKQQNQGSATQTGQPSTTPRIRVIGIQR